MKYGIIAAAVIATIGGAAAYWYTREEEQSADNGVAGEATENPVDESTTDEGVA